MEDKSDINAADLQVKSDIEKSKSHKQSSDKQLQDEVDMRTVLGFLN